MLSLKKLMIFGVLNFIFLSGHTVFAHNTDCDTSVLIQGPVSVFENGDFYWQHVQFNHTPSGCKDSLTGTRGQLYFSRTNKGLCQIKSMFHLPPVRSIEVWVDVNGKDQLLPMKSENYGYGLEHQAFFSCPANEPIKARFAFDIGNGKWDNNSTKDYQVTLPVFK